MDTHTEKTQENQSQMVSVAGSLMQSNSDSIFQFVDNRPEAIAQRKLQELANNNPQMRELKAVQKMANKSLKKSKLFSTNLIIQKKPETIDGKLHDPDYPYVEFTKNEDESDQFEAYYDATGPITNPKTVKYEENRYWDLSGEIWVPAKVDEDEEMEHYKVDGRYDNIVEISSIEYEGIGNITAAKSESIKAGIKNANIPAIKVKLNPSGTNKAYTLVNGRNRIAVSLDANFTKIPIIIDGTS